MRCASCGHTQGRGRFCGGCGARIGDGAAAADAGRSPPAAHGAAGATGGPARSGRGRMLIVGAVLAGVALAAGILLLDGDSGTRTPGRVALPTAPAGIGPVTPGSGSTPGPSPTPTVGFDFGGRTGTALVFEEGAGDAVVIDLDGRRRTSLGLADASPAAQPFQLVRLGGWLVYGRGTIWAVDPGSRHPTRRLGEATRFVPAAAPDRLWLVDDSGGGSGGPRETWRLVDPGGQVLHEHRGAAGLRAVRGVPGGLAVRDPDSGALRRYDPDTGRVGDFVGGPDARVSAVSTRRFAWCEAGCSALHVGGTAAGTVTTLEGGGIVEFGKAWLSPGGSHLAAYVRVRQGTGVNFEVRVYALPEGRRVGRQTAPLGSIHGAWTADGEQFFSWIQHPNQRAPPAPALLARYTPADDRFETANLDPQGARLRGFVTVPTEAVAALF